MGTAAAWIGIIGSVVLILGGIAEGFALQSSVGHCVADARKAKAAEAEQQRTYGMEAPGEQADPSHADHQTAETGGGWQPWVSCRWPGLDVDQAIGMGALTFAFYGFVATVLCGGLAVLGIFLTYSLARDEFRRRR